MDKVILQTVTFLRSIVRDYTQQYTISVRTLFVT